MSILITECRLIYPNVVPTGHIVLHHSRPPLRTNIIMAASVAADSAAPIHVTVIPGESVRTRAPNDVLSIRPYMLYGSSMAGMTVIPVTKAPSVRATVQLRSMESGAR